MKVTSLGAKVTVFFTFLVCTLSWGFCQKTILDSFDLTGLLSREEIFDFSSKTLDDEASLLTGEGADSSWFLLYNLRIQIFFATFSLESLRGLFASSSSFAISMIFAELNLGVKNFLTSDWDSNLNWELCRFIDAFPKTIELLGFSLFTYSSESSLVILILF